jgi:hypothetical protein
MRKLYLFLTMMLVTAAGWSQTTYTWQPGAGGSWALATNWSPTRSTPAATDILVIGTGSTMTISNVPAQTIGSLVIQKSGVLNTSVTLTAAAANTLTIGGGTGTDFTIEAGSQLTMGSNVNVTLAASNNVTATIDGTLVVNAGRTLDVNNTAVAVTINGTLQNSGVVAGLGTTLTFASGGKYLHAMSAGIVPTATWDDASTCEITGATTSAPNGLGQTFGNFTWNCASQAANQLQLPGSGFDVDGDFKVVSTGTTGLLELGQAVTSVAGNLEISGGTLQIGDNTNRTLTVTGDMTLSGGTLLMSSGASAADVGTLNVAGDFTQSVTSTITESNAGSGLIAFNGTSTQLFSKSAGSAISNEIDFVISSGATVDFGTSVLNGSTGTFTLNAGGKIITANAGGIPSTITVTGTKTYSSGADYEFQGTATGVFATSPTASTARNITINNTAGNVTLDQPLAVTGVLTLTDGELNTTSTNLITVNDNATVSGASDNSFVNGPIRKIGNDAFTFPVGRNGSGYVPVAVLDDNAGANNTFTAEYFRGTPPNNTNISGTAGVNHISYCDYWSVDRNVAGDIVDVQFNWNANSDCGGVNYVTDPSTVKVVHYNGSQWDLSSPGGGTGTPAAGTVTWVGLNDYSLFALGSTSGSSNPLPVLFDNVKAYTKNDGVQIEWSNLTERDLTKYLVERSANGRDFYSISEYAPKSNQNDRADYTSFDAAPLQGANFYRIKVLEVNGKIIYSKTLRVETGVKQAGFTVYPNPVKGNQVTVALTGVKQGQYNVRMINATGQDVFNKAIVNQSTGVTQTLQLPTVKPGVYTMLISGEAYQHSQLIIIQ